MVAMLIIVEVLLDCVAFYPTAAQVKELARLVEKASQVLVVESNEPSRGKAEDGSLGKCKWQFDMAQLLQNTSR
jgi:hypothetical protein